MPMDDYSFIRNLNRRDFMKIVSVAGIGSLIYPSRLIAEVTGSDKSRVVIVEDRGAVTDDGIDSAVLRIMADEAIRATTGIGDTGEAWKSVFAGINAFSRIALKVNAFHRLLPTRPEYTAAVTDSIAAMKFNGNYYNPNNMIVFDKTNSDLTDSKYTINESATGVRCFGSSNLESPYDSTNYSINGESQNVSRIITDYCDYLVNLAVLKSHSIAGVSLCMKNHYGSCSNPGQMHGNACNPFIPELNSIAPIKNKHSLAIIDALYGTVSDNPILGPEITPKKIIMGTDIVAVDFIGRKTLEEYGCKTTGTAAYIDTAASVYQLGAADMDKIELITITDPAGTGSVQENGRPAVVLRQNSPNPFTQSTTIRFTLDADREIQITILDLSGTVVKRLAAGAYPSGNNSVAWDGRDESGFRLPSGVYVCSLAGGRVKKSIIMRKLD